jgi:diacylglycerol kinase (ATP)
LLAEQVVAVRITIIHNPTAGGSRRRLFGAVIDELARRGCVVDIHATGQAGDAQRMAATLDPAGCDRLVVAGGDGTVNEAVNGLMARTDPAPLAVLPLGTANVLAIEIGLRFGARAITRTIVEGPVRRVTLGRLNERYFLLMAGVGFDAHAVRSVDLGLKRHLGKTTYVLAALRSMMTFGDRRYEVQIDGTAHRPASLIVINGRHYAGPYVVAPEASLLDGSLHVCLFERSGRHQIFAYMTAMSLGLLPRMPGYRVIPAQRVSIAGAAGETLQCDGDIDGTLPAEIAAVPEALDLVFPA